MNLLRNLLGLSRVPHSLLDVALPAFCALVWLGDFPSMKVVLLGLITATSAYLAIYALNDLVDYAGDREKASLSVIANHEGYIDAFFTIHPLAKGILSFKAALFWVSGLLLIALIGAYLLNPFTIIILAIGALCEMLYCLLFKKNPLRILLSGMVKSCGPMAAVFAVDNHPNLYLLCLLFAFIFLWEIGGQNIPADWIDIEQDKAVHAKTFPIEYGVKPAKMVILGCLMLSIFANLSFLVSLPNPYHGFWLLSVLVLSLFVLTKPAYRLYRTELSSAALALFNRASYFPFWMLVLACVQILINQGFR